MGRLKDNVLEQILSAITAMIKFMLEMDIAVTQKVSALLMIQTNQHFVNQLPLRRLKDNVLEQILSATMAMIKFMLEMDNAVTQKVSALLKIQTNQHFVSQPPMLRLKDNVLEQILSATTALIKFMLEMDNAVTQEVSALLTIQMNLHFVNQPPMLRLKDNVMEQILSATT